MRLSRNGINYQYFEGTFSRTADIKAQGQLIQSGVCDKIGLSVARNPDHFGIVFGGFIYAPVDGVYSFATRSDDGSVLRIDDQLVVDNDGSHAEIKAVGRIALKKGFHPYELLYFEDYEGEALSMSWTIPGKAKEEIISSDCLFIK